MRLSVSVSPRLATLQCLCLCFGPVDVLIEHLHGLKPSVMMMQAVVVDIAVCRLEDADCVFLVGDYLSGDHTLLLYGNAIIVFDRWCYYLVAE